MSNTAPLKWIEIARLRPHEGALEELMHLRPLVLQEFSANAGTQFTSTLSLSDDGTIIDIWAWADREAAELAAADPATSPSFQKWNTLVELVSLEWSRVL